LVLIVVRRRHLEKQMFRKIDSTLARKPAQGSPSRTASSCPSRIQFMKRTIAVVLPPPLPPHQSFVRWGPSPSSVCLQAGLRSFPAIRPSGCLPFVRLPEFEPLVTGSHSSVGGPPPSSVCLRLSLCGIHSSVGVPPLRPFACAWASGRFQPFVRWGASPSSVCLNSSLRSPQCSQA